MRTCLALGLTAQILMTGVASACSLSLEPVIFGVIDPTRLNQSTGKVTVDCPVATAYQVSVTGEALGGQRVMRRIEGDILFFQLFNSPALSIPWGDNVAIGPSVSGTSDGNTPSELAIYGAVPPQQGILPGNYTGQLSVLLSF